MCKLSGFSQCSVINAVALFILTTDFHELVALVETLLVKAARVLFVTVKAYRLQVLRHHDVYLTGPGLTVHLPADDGQDPRILAAHVVEITQVIETAELTDA